MLRKIFATVLCLGILFSFTKNSNAQSDKKRPLDLVVVIDNSGSMFPASYGFDTCCSDPNFLRIAGAELFLARLGFAEINEQDYQIGVISLGDTNNMLVSPLVPIQGARDALAITLKKPAPENETRIVDALNAAYDELSSPRHKPESTPAIVLLTDGVPTPGSGQTDADIEKLINDHKDIPVFIMLLQGESNVNEAKYKEYVKLWKGIQLRSSALFAYEIQSAGQIEQTYNEIIAQLQNTIPAPPEVLQPNIPFPIYVDAYVRKIVITIMHEEGQSRGNIEIKDKNKALVLDMEPGVEHFQGENNRVEVISIANPRLSDALKNGLWTITSDRTVRVFLDREGAYQFSFRAPQVSITGTNNVYLVSQRVSPKQEFNLEFQLNLVENGTVITEAQPIQGEIIYPNNATDVLRIPTDLKPDANGVYRIPINFASLYPNILNTAGRFTIKLKAGSADPNAQDRIPIAKTMLLVDVGVIPYLNFPSSITCAPEQPIIPFTVSVGDFQSISAQNANMRVLDPKSGGDIPLQLTGTGEFSGDLSPLCKAAALALSCSQGAQTQFTVRLVGQMTDGSPLLPIESPINVNLAALPCTPLPPTPMPEPDTDTDLHVDPVDACPTLPSWAGLDYFNGCPPPIWLLILLGALGVGFLAFLILYLWPWVKVNWISPPPKAYVLVKGSAKVSGVKSIYTIGTTHRVNQITIGKSKKANLCVSELQKNIEFTVTKKDGKVILQKESSASVTFSDDPQQISTSNSGITLWIGLDSMKLNKK